MRWLRMLHRQERMIVPQKWLMRHQKGWDPSAQLRLDHLAGFRLGSAGACLFGV